MEQWEEIIGYNGNYLVSDQGRIKSVSRITNTKKVLRKDNSLGVPGLHMNRGKYFVASYSSDKQNFSKYFSIDKLGYEEARQMAIDELMANRRDNQTKETKEKILKQKTNSHGYKEVSLSLNNKVKNFLVHRLVAEAFIDNYEDKPYINHKNCKKVDNRAYNLEWVTPKENSEHYYENYHVKKERNIKPLICKTTNKKFESSYEAAEWLNNTKFKNTKKVSDIANKIRRNCSKKQKIVYGMKFEYLD